MKPHQDRVVVEKRELDEKLEKLGQFVKGDLFRGLPQDEQLRLLWQKMLMAEYSCVLSDRIACFEDDRTQQIDLAEISRTTEFVPHQEMT